MAVASDVPKLEVAHVADWVSASTYLMTFGEAQETSIPQSCRSRTFDELSEKRQQKPFHADDFTQRVPDRRWP
jgi:hypothetical protein